MLCAIEPNDLDELTKLVEITVRESVANSEEDAEFLIDDIVKSFKKWLDSNDGGFAYKYTLSNEVIGFILVKGYWNLSHLFVLPSHQRNGIGRRLVTSALDVCREKSPRGKILINSSTTAAEFYDAMGFTQTGPSIDRPGGCIPYEYGF